MLTEFAKYLRLRHVMLFLHKVDPTNLASCDPNKTLTEALRSPNQSYSLLLIAPFFTYRSLGKEVKKTASHLVGAMKINL